MRAKIGHTKMDDLWYPDLKLQPYFKSNKFTVDQIRTIFSFRTRMANFGENFQNGRGHVQCPLCQTHFDSQSMAFQCASVKAELSLNGCYQDIFKEDIPSNLVTTLSRILKFREDILEAKMIQ
jgi:hypothetical protein